MQVTGRIGNSNAALKIKLMQYQISFPFLFPPDSPTCVFTVWYDVTSN
ncbi:hypothetical protein CAter10_4240 [Collimonas arenae]|nr:hypothetical protein CAter10_4240 [Collimonas arenae]